MTTWRRVLATSLLVAVSMGITTQSSGAQDAPAPAPEGGPQVVQSWALFPTGSDDPDQPGNRPDLSYSVPAGTTIDDSVTVANYGNIPLTLRIYAQDAFNNADGGFDILKSTETSKDAGTWVKNEQEFITVPAGVQSTIPIVINVPLDASPGDHVAAVVAAQSTPGTGPDGKTVTLERRTGTRLYVRVDGPLNPDLSVENLRTNYSPSINPLSGTAEISYRIQNRGNVRLSGKQQIEIGGPLGLFGNTQPQEDIPQLLPGQGYDVTRTVDGVSATVAAVTTVDLDPEAVGGGVGEVPTSSGRSISLALPVTIIAILLVLALAWYSRRAYLRHKGEQVPPPAGPGPGSPTPEAPAPRAPVGQSS